ncbi:acyltransferase [Pseudomonas sp. GD04087]|uniref:acyltransferase family protein n=1 Tax=unclassified Pseudomonas TaxID=196821 RepID=UPI00244B8EB5|nr:MULTISPECIES: acyltransferase [unclassified Pseudomonas]MDH0288694.1 acyltransferase [Pseudomonas sp. GD04087]MDH1050693.1 acyltransferase [Pseudomonas sp. GD03903]MDH1999130.1 acyltransferase [Pseudomonas sp. GD03691]
MSERADAQAHARFAALDDLRGAAILLVVLYHGVTQAWGFQPPQGGDYWLAFIYAGNSGVTLFFLLSGILVSRPFFLARQRRQPLDLKRYAVQRALRILPLYYLMVVVGVLVTGHYEQLPAALAFLAWGHSLGTFSNVWWSLATEVQFYVVLPLMFLMLTYSRWLVVAALLAWLVVFTAVCLHAVSFGLLGTLYWVLSLGGKLPAFLLGMGIGWALVERRLPSVAPRSGQIGLMLLVIMLAAFLQVTIEHGVVEFSLRQPWVVLPESLLWGAVAWLMLATPGLGGGAATRPLRYLGRISYSLYLIHLPVIMYCLSFAETRGEPVALGVSLGLGLSLVLAHLSYSAIEKPFLSLKSRYSSSTQLSEASPV